MRARWLKPEFFTDKKVASLGPIAALVFQALWCMADDGGTAPCDADTVKAQMFYRWSAVGVPEITEALHALSATGRIVRYVVGDDTYATIPTWGDHQKVHKPSTFRYPDVEQGVVLGVPEECLTGASPLPASPPPRHLDSQTPRSLEGADAPPPRIRVVHAPWVQEGVDWWVLNVGATTPAKFSKALSSSVALLSWERLFPDLRDWAAEKVRNKKPLKPEWYAEIASGRLSPKPEMVDKFGVLTEYGERMTRPVSA